MNEVKIKGTVNYTNDYYIYIETPAGEVAACLDTYTKVEDGATVEAVGYLKRSTLGGNMFFINELTIL